MNSMVRVKKSWQVKDEVVTTVKVPAMSCWITRMISSMLEMVVCMKPITSSS